MNVRYQHVATTGPDCRDRAADRSRGAACHAVDALPSVAMSATRSISDCDVGHPVACFHVANADELKVRVAFFGLDLLANRVCHAVAGLSGKPAIDAIANAHRDFARERPALFAACRHPLSAEQAEASGGVRIANAMRSALGAYRIGDVATTHAVRLIGSVLLGYPTLELAGSFRHTSQSSEASWQAALDSIHVMLCWSLDHRD